MKNSFFISATDTGVGKTFQSIKLLKSFLDADHPIEDLAYFKPVQTGDEKDYDTITQAIPGIAIYNSFDFKYPASPHFAAGLESRSIDPRKIKEDFAEIQAKHKIVIVEGAGGLAVPITKDFLMVDLIKLLDLPLLLVISNKLGTINHSLMSIDYARSRGIEILGLLLSEIEESNAAKQDSIETIKEISGLDIFSCQLIST